VLSSGYEGGVAAGASNWQRFDVRGHVMVRPSQLSRVSLFASLGEQELKALAAACHPRTYRRDEVLFHEDEPGNALYVLLSGHVKIVQQIDVERETILSLYGPGESLGEMSLMDGGPRCGTAIALDSVKVVTLHREAFLALARRHPEVVWTVASRLSVLVRRANQQIHVLSALSVTARVARKLLELADQYGRVTPAGIRIAVPLTQQELAQTIGSNRITVNKQLRQFQEAQILTADRRGITLRQPEQLKQRIH
jgi:CRP/FNR family transcriptional regulator